MKPTAVKYYAFAISFIFISFMILSVAKDMPRLPERIPVHFDNGGAPNGWDNKNSLWTMVLVPIAITLMLFLINRFIPKLRKYPSMINSPGVRRILQLPEEKQQPYWEMLSAFFAVFSSSINLLFLIIIHSSIQIGLGKMQLLSPLTLWISIGIMFVIVTYFMVSLNRLSKKMVQGTL